MKELWLLAALAAAALVSSQQPASAEVEGPWCAHIGIGEDSTVEKCDMMTFEQCREETMSMGANHCAPNPRYYAKAKTPAPKRHQTKKQRDR